MLRRQEAIVPACIFDATPSARCKNRGWYVPLVSHIECNVVREGFSKKLHTLWDWSILIEDLGGMCEGCVEVLHELDKAERRRIWDAPPQTLGITIEGWRKSDGGEGVGNPSYGWRLRGCISRCVPLPVPFDSTHRRFSRSRALQ